MAELILTEINKMGERDEKYGQTWWGRAEGQGYPIMFNLMEDTDLSPMDKISYDTMEVKTSSKGTEYRRLKKVKLVGKASPAQDNNEVLKLIREIHEAVVGTSPNKVVSETLQEPPHDDADNKGYDQEDDEIDLSVIPF